MRSLLIVAVFVPFLSFGQKLEVSEMAGCGRVLTDADVSFGFSNEVSVNYHFFKHFSLGAFYEFNIVKPWHPYNINNHSFGITPEVQFKHIYFGADISMAKAADQDGDQVLVGHTFATSVLYTPTVKDALSITYGGHFGLKQKISKHMSLKEQLGLAVSSLSVGREAVSNGYTSTGEYTYTHWNVDQALLYYYLLAGISYRL